MRESTAAIVASVVETTRRPGSSSSTTPLWPWANFLHQRHIAGLVKYVILLIFRILKFRNIHFVGDLILSTSYELDMATLSLKSSPNVQPSAIRLLWAKGLSKVQKVCSWSRKCCWWGRTRSPCCFDNRCNDHSGWLPHAVKRACYGINVYMNLDDTLKNETLMFDV